MVRQWGQKPLPPWSPKKCLQTCGDIICIPAGGGWLCLATVIAVAARRVVGWDPSGLLGSQVAADALKAAWHQRQPEGPVVFHSGRGSQYVGRAFAALAAAHDIRLFVGRTGVCRGSALAGSFFAGLKDERSGLGSRSPAGYKSLAA
ncbi:DDE-type integrase/transposase/recombinase [Streptomyces sp. gCLA4]|uniref:DDE-type integrase/transposase/recombinase n=1 Tax=Streptomyces sp. gCLA4 TaxID=1873416 RepID=UPI0016020903|nr:DDE-type integrase/transposase/recombinase [Streptomyces sp. gCLA4]